MIGAMSYGHWIIVIGVIVLLFGKNTISRLASDIAGGIKNARKACNELEKE